MNVRLVWAAGLLAGLLTGCQTAPVVDQMERAWLAQAITDYRIEVLVVNSIWHAQSHQITVRAGQMADAAASCIPAPFEGGQCRVEAFTAEDFTVAGLFRKVRSLSTTPPAEITYDPAYHFPSQIAFDDPNLVDEDWMWRVTGFEVLK